MTDPTMSTITLSGTPEELGEQVATQLFRQPVAFAQQQLSADDFALFCMGYLAATAGLMTPRLGRDLVVAITGTLAAVVAAEAQELRGPTQ